MGCDIHIIAEVKENGVWRENTDAVFPNPDYEPRSTAEWSKDKFKVSPHDGRHYVWFAILAGVRNTHFLNPISEPKGFPYDASRSAQLMEEEWGCDLHSQSYITHTEFKEYDWRQDILVSRALDLHTYAERYAGEIKPIVPIPGSFYQFLKENQPDRTQRKSLVAIKEDTAIELLKQLKFFARLSKEERVIMEDLDEGIKLNEEGKIVKSRGTNWSNLRIVVPCMTGARYDEVAEYSIKHTVEPLKELGKKYEDARIVFGFDN